MNNQLKRSIKNENIKNDSLFTQFETKKILKLWNECITLDQIANKLANFKLTNKGFTINDYKYIHSILTRENWLLYY